MPLSNVDRAKGEKRPATPGQRASARRWALKNKPWLKSSGPRTPKGKSISAWNAHQSFFKRTVKLTEVADFERECEVVERLIALLRLTLEVTPDIQFEMTINRRAVSDEAEHWICFLVKIQIVCDDQQLPQVWRQLELLVELCGW